MAVRFHDASKALLVPITSVRQLPDNYRNGDIEALMESITVNGFYGAVLVNYEGVILAGNHRYQALLGLGADSIPVLYADGDHQAGLRIAVADNRLSDMARNDPALLLDFLEQLRESEEGLLGTGYVQDDLEQLLLSIQPPPLPGGGGFGEGLATIFQVVIECESEADVREVLADALDRGWNAREVIL